MVVITTSIDCKDRMVHATTHVEWCKLLGPLFIQNACAPVVSGYYQYTLMSHLEFVFGLPCSLIH